MDSTTDYPTTSSAMPAKGININMIVPTCLAAASIVFIGILLLAIRFVNKYCKRNRVATINSIEKNEGLKGPEDTERIPPKSNLMTANIEMNDLDQRSVLSRTTNYSSHDEREKGQQIGSRANLAPACFGNPTIIIEQNNTSHSAVESNEDSNGRESPVFFNEQETFDDDIRNTSTNNLESTKSDSVPARESPGSRTLKFRDTDDLDDDIWLDDDKLSGEVNVDAERRKSFDPLYLRKPPWHERRLSGSMIALPALTTIKARQVLDPIDQKSTRLNSDSTKLRKKKKKKGNLSNELKEL